MRAVDCPRGSAELGVDALLGHSAELRPVQLSQHHRSLVQHLHLGQPGRLPQHLGPDDLAGDVGTPGTLVLGVGLGPGKQVIPWAQRWGPRRQQTVLDHAEASVTPRRPRPYVSRQRVEGSEGQHLFDRRRQRGRRMPLHDPNPAWRISARLGEGRQHCGLIGVQMGQWIDGCTAAACGKLVQHHQNGWRPGRQIQHWRWARSSPLEECLRGRQPKSQPVPVAGPFPPRIEVLGKDKTGVPHTHHHNSSRTAILWSKVCSARVRALAASRREAIRPRSASTPRAISTVSSGLCCTRTSVPGS